MFWLSFPLGILWLCSSLNFEVFSFFYDVRQWSNIILLHEAIQFFSASFIEEAVFISLPPHIIQSCPFCCRLSICVQVYFWGLFCSLTSMSFFLCQCQTILINAASYFSLNLESVLSKVWFFFFKASLSIQGLLYFHTHFRITYSSQIKNVMGILIGISLNLHSALISLGILAILILPILEHSMCFHLLCHHQFLSSMSYSFRSQVFHLLG